MRGQRIIHEFFKLFHQHYALGIPNFDNDVDDGLYTFDEIIDEFKTKPAFNALVNSKFLVEIFKVGSFNPIFLTDHFVPFRKVEIINFGNGKFRKRNRSFYYADNDFGYFSYKKTFEKKLHLDAFNGHAAAISNIQQFVSSCITLNRRDKVIEMLNSFEQGNKNSGLLLQKINHRKESINIYSFIYFRYLCQGGTVEIDDKLTFVSNPTFSPPFTNSNKYSQFFEVFDVANEINHSEDIISRFLKVYHVIEYLSYRVRLVKIEEKARSRVTFIREVSSLQNGNEEDFLKKCFASVFNLDIPTIRGKLNLTDSLKDFIALKFSIPKNEMALDNFLPRLIYRIRNSIVHNKESEFHITISNPEEYSKMIKMMHNLIIILEIVVYKRINEPKDSINYGSPVIELY